MMETPIESSEKISQIIEIYRTLNEDEKQILITHMAEEKELMSMLLRLLIDKNKETAGEFDDAQGYIGFLRSVEED